MSVQGQIERTSSWHSLHFSWGFRALGQHWGEDAIVEKDDASQYLTDILEVYAPCTPNAVNKMLLKASELRLHPERSGCRQRLRTAMTLPEGQL